MKTVGTTVVAGVGGAKVSHRKRLAKNMGRNAIVVIKEQEEKQDMLSRLAKEELEQKIPPEKEQRAAEKEEEKPAEKIDSNSDNMSSDVEEFVRQTY